MLVARSLRKRYGDAWAVDGLDLAVRRAEVVFLCGPNGAGKTTTLRLFAGLAAPTSGSLTVDGISAIEHPLEARRRLSFVPEDVQLHPYLSGAENLAYFYSLGAMRVPLPPEIDAALRAAGLPSEVIHRRAGTYSKGMRQKVALALVTLRESAAVLLDEPTTGLDGESTTELAAALEAMRKRGAAVLAVSHDHEFARATGDRIAVLERGRLVRTIDRESGSAARTAGFHGEPRVAGAPPVAPRGA